MLRILIQILKQGPHCASVGRHQNGLVRQRRIGGFFQPEIPGAVQHILNIFTEKEYYEGKIDPNNGADWNQTAPIDTKPTLDDFKKTVSDYLAWEVSNLLKNQSTEDDRLGK